MAVDIGIGGGKTVTLNEPKRSGFADNLGGAVEYSFAHLVYKVMEIMGDALGKFGGSIAVRFLEHTENELIESFSPFIDYVLSMPGIPPELSTLLENLKTPTSPVAGITAAAIAGFVFFSSMGTVLRTPAEWASQQIARVVETEIPPPAVIVDMARRGNLSWDDAYDLMDRSGIMEGLYQPWEDVARPHLGIPDVLEAYRRGDLDWNRHVKVILARQGYDVEAHTMFKALSKTLLDSTAILTAFFRDEILYADAHKRFTQIGYTGEDADLILRIAPRLPGIGDLVTMAVREAWRDDIAAKWGYDEAFPAEFAEALSKLGYDPDWATRFWRSHWRLPSVTLGYEMMHRRIIGEPELEDLLKISDYPAGWRGKMIEAAYRPFTRVDVRRMYKVGVLNLEQVFEAYLDIGYNPEKAQAMTDFTELYVDKAETDKVSQARDLTRGVIEKAYRKGVIDREEAATRLGDIEYAPDQTDFLLSLIDVERELDVIPDYLEDYQKDLQKVVMRSYSHRLIGDSQAKEYLLTVGLTESEIDLQLAIADFAYAESVRAKELDIIGEAYVKRAIDRTTAIEKLGRLALPSAQQGQHLAEWDLERNLRTRRLTEAQYRKALRDKIITVETYGENLGGLGYSEADVKILVKMATPQAGG